MPDSPGEPRAAELGEDLTGAVVGRFVIRSRLGGGGMGEVYRAEDTALKRLVALKRLAPRLRADLQYRRRFLKEAERASSLTHKNIAGIYDIFEAQGEPFLVMEYVEGTTLRERMKEPVSVEHFAKLAFECAEGLQAAHEKLLVHRDIKPENIMITRSGEVKILDFGVARREARTDPQAETDSNEPELDQGITGTIAYMAPEVLQNQESDCRADLFSLGIVFYEMLAGRHPFMGPNLIATTDRILHSVPPPPSKLSPAVPEDLDRIVDRALAKDPADRYANAGQLLADLRAFSAGEALRHAPRPRREKPWRWVLGLTASLILMLVLASVVLLKQGAFRWSGEVPIPTEKSLVVLPFRAIGGGPDEQVYCDGVTATLTAKLTQLTASNELMVAPAGEVRAQHVSDAQSARKELGATLVLAGTMFVSGDKVRVNYELVNAQTLRQLRADTITAEVADPLAVQDQVAEGAVQMLDLALGPKEQRAMITHGTEVAGAFDLYLQGLGYLQNLDNPEYVDRAIRVFDRALKLDPDYALARAGLGEAFWRKYESTKELKWVDSAREACDRAAEIDPNVAEPHICLGAVYGGTGRYEAAIGEFQKALKAEPTRDDAYRQLADAEERLGKLDQAEDTYRRAIDLRPNYWPGYNALGVFYYKHGRYAEATKMFQRVVELSPGNPRGLSNLGALYHLQGQTEKAIAAYRKSMASAPNYAAASNLGTLLYYYDHDYAKAAEAYHQALALDATDYRIWGNLASAWKRADQPQKSRDALRQAITLAERQLQVNPRDAQVLVDLAGYYADLNQAERARSLLRKGLAIDSGDSGILFRAASVCEELGDRDQALLWLGRALQAGYSREEIERAPDLVKLRQDPRFKKLEKSP
jgi:tetratricopeptide (TPR) repeat protein/predicted Ser/Thr protein kinase